MHRITVNSIGKKDDRCYACIYQDLIDNAKKYANISINNIFNKKINQAQEDAARAKRVYSEILEPYKLDDGLNVALDPGGKAFDTFAFAKMLDEHPKIAFFIGGAYGFEEEFLRGCDRVVSLGALTMSHKIAKAVLLEQIFRGLSIIHNHPYHK